METLQFLLEDVPKSALLESACGLSQWMVSSMLRTDSPLTTVCKCLGKIILTQIIYFISAHSVLFFLNISAELETRMIKRGMESIERGTCVRFVPRTHQEDFIDIKPKSGWVFSLRNIHSYFCLQIQTHKCSINNDAGVGPTLVLVVEGRLSPCRTLTASAWEWLIMSSCTLWASCTSSPAMTGTNMSPSCGQTFGGVLQNQENI